MNKTKTTMEDVAATFGDFEKKVEAKIADMNREQLAGVLHEVIEYARVHAEFAVQVPASAEEEFAQCRAILSAIRGTLGISACCIMKK
ncbi:MAG: hypothetical protein Q4C88_08690 [Akkermansia sp.]|nr:hypothetical protein [Akkermansia sp.]